MPFSDADFALARRAVAKGWLTREQVESAMLSYDRSRGTRLPAQLPLPPPDRNEEIERIPAEEWRRLRERLLAREPE